MKKILSLALAALLLVSMIPTAMAAENNWQGGTKVEYTAATNEQYTVTVPATLAPGGSGDVVASGTWGSNRKLTVTADDDVTLTNSINAADQKVLDVTFAGIELTGSNTESVSDTKQVAVANITDAIFGTWSGTFNYNVAMSDVTGGTETPTPGPEQPDDGGSAVEPGEGQIIFGIDDVTYLAEEGMTWGEWVNSEYNTAGLVLAEVRYQPFEKNYIMVLNSTMDKRLTERATSGLLHDSLTVKSYSGEYSGREYILEDLDDRFIVDPAPTLITFTIDGTEYQAEEGMTAEQWVNSDYSADNMQQVKDGVFEDNYGRDITLNGVAISADTVLVNGAQYVHD